MPGINYNNVLPRGQRPIFALRGRSNQYHCRFCDAVFTDRKALHTHRVREHRLQVGGANMQDAPFEEGDDPFADFPDAEEISELYNDSEVYILEPHNTEDNVFKSFNFPLNGKVTPSDVDKQMREIYQSDGVDQSYKLNISPGFIMRNTENGSLRYFKPSGNAYLMEHPLDIDSRETMEAGIRYLQALDLDEMIRSARPNTKYQVLYITQLTYHVWVVDFPLGSMKTQDFLPGYIKTNKYIYTNFDDEGFENCCIFICLAQHRKLRGGTSAKRIKLAVKSLLVEWHTYCYTNKIRGYPFANPKSFPGIQWEHLHHFEKAFQIRLNIMELLPDQSVMNRYKSVATYKQVLHMNIFKDHLSLIKDVKSYSRKFKCYHCNGKFKKNSRLLRHQKTCAKMTKFVFPSGSYRVQKTIFEEIEEFGINVPHSDRMYTDFIVYDLEALLKPKKRITKSGKTKFTHEHKPISVSIASNVESFRKPKCIISTDPHVLVKGMFEHFDLIRAEINKQSFYKWGVYLQRLEDLIRKRFTQLQTTFSEHKSNEDNNKGSNDNLVSESDLSDMEDSECQDDAQPKENDSRLREFTAFVKRDHQMNNLLRAYRKFYMYIHRCVILTFNGQKYDVHLVSTYMIRMFLDKKENNKHSGETVTESPSDQAGIEESQNEDARGQLAESHNVNNAMELEFGEEDTLMDYMDSDSGSDADSDTSTLYDSEDDYMSDSEESLPEGEYMDLLGGGGGEGCDGDILLDEWNASVDELIEKYRTQEAGDLSVLKRNNNYVFFANNEFIMLDVTNWLSPGTSYSSFLSAYGVQEKKFFLPYQALSSEESLDQWIPEYDSDGWLNSLKNNEHLMEQEYLRWERNGRKGHPPKTGKENYEMFKEVCKKENLKTLRQLLEYYNNLDTYPFVKGVENMIKEYSKMSLDLFKISFGTPGLARAMLMRSAQRDQTFFPLFNKENSDLYFMFKRMSTGGPSIISVRRAEVGKTHLRADKKELVSSIYGHDCNSMYLTVLKGKMPTTMYVRRKAKNSFKPEYRRNYLKMLVWLEMIQRQTGEFVRSKASNGYESRFMSYYLDGLIVKEDGSLIALEFLGE